MTKEPSKESMEKAREIVGTAHINDATGENPDFCKICGKNFRRHLSVGETLESRIVTALDEKQGEINCLKFELADWKLAFAKDREPSKERIKLEAEIDRLKREVESEKEVSAINNVLTGRPRTTGREMNEGGNRE